MPTIKALIVERRRLRGRSDDDNSVKELVCRYLKNVCKFFPDATPEGMEFLSVMSKFVPLKSKFEGVRQPIQLPVAPELVPPRLESLDKSSTPFQKTIERLTEKAMDERDDLSDYKELRQKLVEEICRR